MKKLKDISDSTVARYAMVASVVAAVAAAISAWTAYKSWDYNKRLTRATISLEEVKVDGMRQEPGKLRIRLLFIFRNVGDEPLSVIERTWGHFDFKSTVFTHVGNDRGLVNKIFPGGIFNHPAILYLTALDPNLSNEKVVSSLPDWVQKHAIAFLIRFQGERSSEQAVRYYVGYKGKSNVFHLTDEEYLEIEKFLPEKFRQ